MTKSERRNLFLKRHPGFKDAKMPFGWAYQYRAYSLFKKALDAGKLVRPEFCEWCGKHKSEAARNVIEAHHTNYSRPYDVIWLCAACHRQEDMLNRKRTSRQIVNNIDPNKRGK